MLDATKQKAPRESAILGAFLFRFGRVAQSLGWLPFTIPIQLFANIVGDYTYHNRK